MKITLELPDSATCLGLFINFKSDEQLITTTNWLTKAENNKTICVDSSAHITEREG